MTTLLFNNALAPVTSELGFFERDPSTVAAAFIVWQKPIQEPRGVSFTQKSLQGDLKDIIQTLFPLTSVEHRRFVFVPTRSRWTALLSNGWRGSDVSGPVLVLSERISCRTARVVATLDTINNSAPDVYRTFGATIFELYGPDSMKVMQPIRIVSSMDDGGRWVFDSIGTPFAFEQQEMYTKRRIRDRFTVDMLDAYLREFEIHAFDPDFYMPSGQSAILVEKHGPIAEQAREYTLAEARQT